MGTTIRQETLRRLFVAVVAAACGLAPGRPAGAAVLDYLYVESNEGSSSGGHVALRLGDRVFDFQHHEPGVVRLGRRDAGDFLHAYAWLQNRPVHATRLEVTDDAFETLRAHFQSRYLEESARFAALDVLRDDARLLADLAATDGQRATVRVPGAGFFVTSSAAVDAPSAAPSAASPAVVELRAAAARRFGDGWLPNRLEAERRALASVEPSVLPPEDLGAIGGAAGSAAARAAGEEVRDDVGGGFGGPAGGAWPRVEAAYSRRCRDRLAAVAALEALRGGGCVAPGALVEADDGTPPLAADERAALAAFARRQEGDLVHLLASRREDWGPAFLVGLARLVAVERSLASGRLVVVDAFPAEPRTLSRDAVERSGVVEEIARDAAADLAALRREFVAAARDGQTPVERDYAALELAASRRREWTVSAAEGRDVRMLEDEAIPSRAALLPLTAAFRSASAARTKAGQSSAAWASAGPTTATTAEATNAAPTSARSTNGSPTNDARLHAHESSSLDELARRAAALLREHEDSLLAAYRYDLVRRNCVSEIFRTMDDAFGGRARAARSLGMTMPGGGADAVVPFLSAETVEGSPSSTGTRVFASLRERRLVALDARTGASTASRLREAWVPTATTYRRHPEDSFFVLFADWPPARPLVGAANLAAGTLATAAGALAAPFVGLGPATSGLRGIVYSLPELAFVRIRRGSFVYAPRSEAVLPDGW